MSTLRMTGWEKGLQKISLTKAIQQHTGKPLSEAKQCVDDLLEGREVTLAFPSDAERDTFRHAAEDLGARFS